MTFCNSANQLKKLIGFSLSKNPWWRSGSQSINLTFYILDYHPVSQTPFSADQRFCFAWLDLAKIHRLDLGGISLIKEFRIFKSKSDMSGCIFLELSLFSSRDDHFQSNSSFCSSPTTSCIPRQKLGTQSHQSSPTLFQISQTKQSDYQKYKCSRISNEELEQEKTPATKGNINRHSPWPNFAKKTGWVLLLLPSQCLVIVTNGKCDIYIIIYKMDADSCWLGKS